MPEQETAQQDAQMPPFILSFAPYVTLMPVNIDPVTSINLAAVRSYQVIELDILDKNNEPTGKKRPAVCVFFTETDYLELTPAQDKTFKFYWNIYSRATGFILQSMAQMFQPAEPQQVTEGTTAAAQ